MEKEQSGLASLYSQEELTSIADFVSDFETVYEDYSKPTTLEEFKEFLHEIILFVNSNK